MTDRANARELPHFSCPESQQVSPVDGDLWLELMRPTRDRFAARAVDRTLTPSQNAYGKARARVLSSPPETRVEVDDAGQRKLVGCSVAGTMVRCGCPGKRARWFTCRRHLLCPLCQVKRAKTLRARFRNAIEKAGKRNASRRPIFITLTLPHSGDVGADRRALSAGWRRFYKAIRRRIGPFEYVGVHEVTAGRDGLGHAHAHILAWWPWFNWKARGVYALWTASCPGSKRLRLETARSVRGAAKYLGKYLSKGVNTDDFSPELRARVLAGTYGTRWVFTSVRMWTKFEPCCQRCKMSVRRDIVALSGNSDHRWTTAQERSTRRGFPDEHELPGYQFTIERLSQAE